MDIDQLNINAVCFGILCNFAPVCGEERAKEAVELVRALQAENAKLHAEIEKEMKHRKTQADIMWYGDSKSLRIYNRLAAIEDILGEQYDLDRLRELTQADKEGRCAVLPCKPGDRILIDGRKAIIVEFFGYETERYFRAQFYDNMQYIDIPFEEIGKTVFIAHEEAEAALRREQK